jgi:hypothetical protein
MMATGSGADGGASRPGERPHRAATPAGDAEAELVVESVRLLYVIHDPQ